MFTGIVETTGRVRSIARNDFGVRLVIDRGDWSRAVNPGDSICVNGCCLTHAPGDDEGDTSGGGGASGGGLAFDVVKETLDKTTLGSLKVGDAVNLEASLTPTTAMGGHFVQGHIDGIGEVAALHAGEDEWRVTFRADRAMMRYIVPKGSISIEGVSLTIASVDLAASTFAVVLIPTTLKVTTLSTLKVGSRVNLESDMIARTVAHWLESRSGASDDKGVTLATLREAGFVR